MEQGERLCIDHHLLASSWPGAVPASHVFFAALPNSWMPGISAGHDEWKSDAIKRHRGAHRVRSMLILSLPSRPTFGPPLARGRERRAERRKPMVSVSVAGHGGRLSARHYAALVERRAARFVWIAPPASAAALMRSSRDDLASPRQSGLREGGSARANPSASSWRGLVVVPGGAPASARVPDPRDRTRGRRTPSRYPNASRSALQWTERGQDKGAPRSGDKIFG